VAESVLLRISRSDQSRSSTKKEKEKETNTKHKTQNTKHKTQNTNTTMTGKRKPGMSLASDHCMHTTSPNQSNYYHSGDGGGSDTQVMGFTQPQPHSQNAQSQNHRHSHSHHTQHPQHPQNAAEHQKRIEQCANCGAVESKAADKLQEAQQKEENSQEREGGREKKGGGKGNIVAEEEGKENPESENGSNEQKVIKLSICSNCYQGLSQGVGSVEVLGVCWDSVGSVEVLGTVGSVEMLKC
jgi:hypothetical protein